MGYHLCLLTFVGHDANLKELGTPLQILSRLSFRIRSNSIDGSVQ